MTRYIDPKHHTTYTQVPDWLLSRKELSPGAKLCYSRLARWYGADEQHPHVASVAQTTLAEEMAVSERQIYTYIRELMAVKLIEPRRRGKGHSNVYVFPDHPWRDDTAPDVPGDDRKDTSDQNEAMIGSLVPIKTGRILPIKTAMTGRILPGKIQSPRYNQKDTTAPHADPIRTAWSKWHGKVPKRDVLDVWWGYEEQAIRAGCPGLVVEALEKAATVGKDPAYALGIIKRTLSGEPSPSQLASLRTQSTLSPPASPFLGTPSTDTKPTLSQAEIDAIQNRRRIADLNGSRSAHVG